MITLAQIHAAQTNDLDGIRAVLDEMNERIDRLASQTASSMGTNPARYADYVNDFRQDAMVSLFEYLPRWEGDSVDSFRAYIYGAIAGDLKAKAHAERNPGADRDAMSIFKAMVEQAEGDVFAAERMAQTVPPKGKRISADRAHAARLAWQGSVSIDKQSGDDEGASIADTLVATQDEQREIHPKVGTGAALEALAVLQRYGTDPKVLNALPADAEGVYAIEDALTVPRDPAERRYVLDAVAILHSYVSTATDGEVIEELRTVADERGDERAANIGAVREVINALSPAQASALCLTFGIAGHESYGRGDGSDVEGFAAALGTSVNSANKTRSLAFKNFAARWIARVAKTVESALSWEAAAVEARKRGGRK
ncbi:hypothetical protein ACQEV9_15505 [Streptomyces chartreusis]|uniref:hypothetical protein n=1 Tax=Streptomyces chartreusis TaxID=1969 RepID=UPI003D8B4D97